MNTTARKILSLCSAVMMLVLVAGIIAVPASAAGNGIYTVSVYIPIMPIR